MTVRQLLDQMLNLGMPRGASPQVTERVRVGNGSAMILVCLGLVALFYEIVAGLRIWSILPAVAALLGLFAMDIARRGHHGAARLWLISSVNALAIAIYFVVGGPVAQPLTFALLSLTFANLSRADGWHYAVGFAVTVLTVVAINLELLPGGLLEIPADRVAMTRYLSLILSCVAVSLIFIHMTRSRVLAFRQLEGSIETAQTANQAKSQFLAHMSHELRTPLSAIVGYTDLSLDPLTQTEERVDHLQIIRRNGKHLERLVDQLLDLAKVEADELTIDRRPTELTSVLTTVATAMQVRATDKGLSLDVRLDDEVPRIVQTDPLRLTQILLNLVGNAIKFSDSGGIALTAGMRGDTLSPELTLEVSDQGPGIADKDREVIFRPFVQGEVGMKRRFGGTGLGLSISAELVRLLGGSIEVTSTLGQGAAFTVRLPLSEEEASGEFVRAGDLSVHYETNSERYIVPTDLAGRRVLLVEDSRDLRLLVRLRLARQGIKVTEASDGYEALAAVAQSQADGAPIELILMDIQMPRMDGYEATQRLRADGFQHPIIALTAHAMLGDRERSLDAGCDEYLTKPIDFEALFQRLAEYLGERTWSDSRPRVAAGAPPPPVRTPGESGIDEQLRALGETYLVRLPPRVQTIEAAVERGDLEGARGEAHKLAGSAGSFGFDEVSLTARVLEQELSAQGDRGRERLDQLIAAVQRAMARSD